MKLYCNYIILYCH